MLVMQRHLGVGGSLGLSNRGGTNVRTGTVLYIVIVPGSHIRSPDFAGVVIHADRGVECPIDQKGYVPAGAAREIDSLAASWRTSLLLT